MVACILTASTFMNTNSSEVSADFSSEVAMHSYSQSGDMIAQVSDVDLYNSFVSDNAVPYGRSTYCSTGCSTG